MSMYIISRTTAYAVMLADHLAYREFEQGNKAPLNAPKLTHIAPCVFAAHAGSWQAAFEIFSNFHDYLLASPQPRTFDDIAQYLEQESNRCYQKYCELWKRDKFDLRLPIVLTGPYRCADDFNQQISSTIIICETANKFKPTPVHGAWWAATDEATQIVTALIDLPATKYMQTTGPLSLAQVLKAIHAFIANLCIYISPDCSIVVIGDEDEYTVIEGQITSLPMRALRYG